MLLESRNCCLNQPLLYCARCTSRKSSPSVAARHTGEHSMYCPNCGVENVQGQKYCRRCGVSLSAADYAREFVNEATTGNPTDQPHQTAVPMVLKATVLVSILGFLFVTIGAVIMTSFQFDSPDGRHG